jgi:hypothetical protein
VIDCKNARCGKLQNKHLSRDPTGSRLDGGCVISGLCSSVLKFPENETTVPKSVGV